MARFWTSFQVEESMRPALLMAAVLMLMVATATKAAEPAAEEVANRIQKFYDGTRDFQAAFQQEYESKALGRKKSSSGFVYIKKPGRMRWTYEAPEPSLVVSDGVTLWIYDPAFQEAQRREADSMKVISSLTSMISPLIKITHI